VEVLLQPNETLFPLGSSLWSHCSVAMRTPCESAEKRGRSVRLQSLIGVALSAALPSFS
jgi:hypothetical protein